MSNRTAILVALIGLVGTISAALIANWESVFPSRSVPPSQTAATRKVAAPEGPTVDLVEGEFVGKWHWTARCPTGSYKGEYEGHWDISRHDAQGNITGEFSNGHFGAFQGRISGSTVQFVRIFVRASTNISQEWTGTISWETADDLGRIRLKGHLTDPAGGCTFDAEKQ